MKAEAARGHELEEAAGRVQAQLEDLKAELERTKVHSCMPCMPTHPTVRVAGAVVQPLTVCAPRVQATADAHAARAQEAESQVVPPPCLSLGLACMYRCSVRRSDSWCCGHRAPS